MPSIEVVRHQTEVRKVGVCLNATSVLLFFIGLITDGWVSFSGGHAGLFKFCNESVDNSNSSDSEEVRCDTFEDVPAFLHMTRGLAITCIILRMISLLFLQSLQCNPYELRGETPGQKHRGEIWHFIGLCFGVSALLVFGLRYEDIEVFQDGYLAYSFILCGVGLCLAPPSLCVMMSQPGIGDNNTNNNINSINNNNNSNNNINTTTITPTTANNNNNSNNSNNNHRSEVVRRVQGVRNASSPYSGLKRPKQSPGASSRLNEDVAGAGARARPELPVSPATIENSTRRTERNPTPILSITITNNNSHSNSNRNNNRSISENNNNNDRNVAIASIAGGVGTRARSSSQDQSYAPLPHVFRLTSPPTYDVTPPPYPYMDAQCSIPNSPPPSYEEALRLPPINISNNSNNNNNNNNSNNSSYTPDG